MVYKIPIVGKSITVRITRIEPSTAGEAFKSRITGKFESKYGKASDKVFRIYGKPEGTNEEVLLTTVNAPRNQSGTIHEKSKLYHIAINAGFDPKSGVTFSDDLRELKGRSVQAKTNSNGFPTL